MYPPAEKQSPYFCALLAKIHPYFSFAFQVKLRGQHLLAVLFLGRNFSPVLSRAHPCTGPSGNWITKGSLSTRRVAPGDLFGGS